MKIGRSISTMIAAHSDLSTGVHGVGADSIISDAEAILQALLTTRGDILFRGASVAERLAKGTAGQLLKQGANDPEWATVGAPTKEIFIPIFYGSPAITTKGALVDAEGESAKVALLVPQDFTTIIALEVILIPQETGASMHFDIVTLYGAYNGGEAYNAHSETATARDIGATVTDQYFAEDISDLVDTAPLAAGDLLMVEVAFNATVVDSFAYVVGLRLRYT